MCTRCAWSHHLQAWLHTSINANITVYNLGSPGSNSVFTAEVVSDRMADIGVTSLSSKDVVILDFSVNDNLLSHPMEDMKLKRGLEKLIRYLLGLGNAAEKDMPHIILMEVDVELVGSTENSYRLVYQELAQHYGLHLFSYADMLLSRNSKVLQAAYYEQLIHRPKYIRRYDKHPPWHGHLVYADFVAALLLYQMNLCSANTTVTVPSINASAYVMPVALSTQDELHMCKTGVAPLLKLSYGDIMQKKSIGTFVVPTNNTWGLNLDRRMRGGFITKLNDKYSIQHFEDVLLVFPLGLTLQQWRGTKLFLQIQYMRSYTDAGLVSIGFCGTYHTELDALWANYQHFNHTLKDVYSVSVDPEWCSQQVNEQRKDHTNTTIELNIQYKVIRNDENDTTQLMRKKPRGNQLFKIDSVLLCHSA